MQSVRLAGCFYSVRGLVLLILLAMICNAKLAAASTQVITEADKGGEVHLKVGDQLEVRLKWNPSTGFMWYLQADSSPVLKLVHQSQGEVPEPGVGRPIVQVFKFEPRRAGDGALRLHYVRSWEKPSADEDRFEIHVFIE